MTMRTSLGAELVSLNTIMADQAGFRVWYELALPRVYRYLLARCGGDADLAEELTQQTFVEGVRLRGSFDGRSDAVTRLCGIGRHKLVDHFRRSRRDTERQLRIVSEWSAGQSQAWSQHELRSAVETALAKLPGRATHRHDPALPGPDAGARDRLHHRPFGKGHRIPPLASA
jgi:DNA-directed RNA polymerase specialized sigma24 family protein